MQHQHVVWLAAHAEMSGSLMPPAERELSEVSLASLLVFPTLFVDVSARQASVWCGLLRSFVCLCSSSRSLALTHPSNNSLCFLACFFPSWFVWKGCRLLTRCVIAPDFPLVALTFVHIGVTQICLLANSHDTMSSESCFYGLKASLELCLSVSTLWC